MKERERRENEGKRKDSQEGMKERSRERKNE